MCDFVLKNEEENLYLLQQYSMYCVLFKIVGSVGDSKKTMRFELDLQTK